MVEIYAEKGCVGCMRSSPVASMIGMIIVLFGIGSFGGGFVIAYKFLDPKIFLAMEYVIYGIVIAVVFFIMLSYILAALSSGHNRKRFFEGSRKAKIGRGFTIFNIICLMLSSLTWILVSCAMAFCFIATLITYIRIIKKGESANSIDLSYYGLFNDQIKVKNELIWDILLSITFAFGGSLVVVIGFLQMLCCSAMNYVRLSEERYYDNDSLAQDKSEQVLSAF